MNTFEEQLKRAIKEIKLSDQERSALRKRLVSQMAQTTLPAASRRMYSRTLTQTRIKRTMPIALLIALLMSGGVSYAAEGTAPGDTLYPVKVHVNENVRGALALSDAAKAKLEVDLADRRLKEAEKLEREHRLDATTTVMLRVEFEEHRSRADEHIRSVEGKSSDDAAEISLDLDTRLDSHRSTLGLLGIDGDDDDEGEDRHGGDNGDDRRGNDEGRQLRATTSVTASTSLRVRSEDDSMHRSGDDSDEREQSASAVSSTEVRVESHSRGRDHDEDDGDDEDDDRRGGLIPTIVAPVLTPTPAPTGASAQSTFTLAQIATHNTQSSCYSAISGKVYNLTSFFSGHPGGSAAILSLCGHDGTAGFMAQHGGASRPQSELAALYIGTLVP
jgi:cytochrome b involved in lipid metabolism